MNSVPSDALTGLSSALSALVAGGAPHVVAIGHEHRARTGLLWRPDVIVASEQTLSRRDSFHVVLPGGATTTAVTAGRDRGTNIVVLRLDRPAASGELQRAEIPGVGALAVALGADGSGGATARLGVVRRAGPGWHSQAGGRIDRLVSLDMALSPYEEGGPVLEAAGGLLGMSTLGPRGRPILIPCATIERVLEPLLGQGRVDRGWLGVGLQPVELPEEQRAACGRDAGLMVVSLVAGAPAALAGIIQGDILLDLNGNPVNHLRAVRGALDEGRIGQVVTVRLLRAGIVQTVGLTVAARPAA
ncbi:MAG: serine protease [Alphaproteobacteria bacterium]|nr:serine protease [Alphaproteobacteria bacterium]